LKNCYLIE